MKKRALMVTLFILAILFIGSIKWETEQIKNRREDVFVKSSTTTTIPLWNFTLDKDYCNFMAIAISANGSYIAALGGNGATVYLFNKLSPKPLWNFTIGGYGGSIAISGNGNYIVAGNVDGKICLFHISNNIPIWYYSAGGWIYSVGISFDGADIVAGSGSGSKKVLLFNRTSSIPVWSFSASGLVLRVSITPNGSYIVAGDNIGNFHLFNKNSSIPIWSYNVGEHVLGVSISSDGNDIAMGSAYSDNGTYYFKRESSVPVWKYTTSGSVRSVKISSDGNYIIAGTAHNDKNIYLFNKGSVNPIWNYISDGYVNSVAISSDGSYIAAQNYHDPDLGYVCLFDKSSPVPIWRFQLESADNNGYYAIAMSNDSKYIATTTRYNVYLFDRDIIFPNPFVLTSNAGDPDTDGNFSLSWTTSQYADNYSIYQHSSSITESKNDITTLATEITELILPVKGLSSGDYYFAVEAHNKYGNRLSNNILVKVEVEEEDNTLPQEIYMIPGYEIWMILGSLSFLSIVFVIKIRRVLKHSALKI